MSRCRVVELYCLKKIGTLRYMRSLFLHPANLTIFNPHGFLSKKKKKILHELIIFYFLFLVLWFSIYSVGAFKIGAYQWPNGRSILFKGGRGRLGRTEAPCKIQFAWICHCKAVNKLNAPYPVRYTHENIKDFLSHIIM